ncbi:MAG: hypothetical protein QM605_09155 [Sphingobium sp.]
MSFSSPSRSDFRERAGGLAFALGLNALLLLALLTLAPKMQAPPVDPRNPVTFELAPGPKEAEEKAQAQKSDEKSKEDAPQKQAEAAIRPPRPVEKPPELPPSPLPFLVLDSNQMAAADIGKMPKKGQGQGAAQGDSAQVAGPGEGPGGVQLFAAEWYRRPRDAELSPYLPGNAPPDGWGEVACKTVDNYRVENCQALGESPMGSGFARAVRLAAWQFQVLPPRVNGKVMVGSWVRIRIDYSRKVVGGPDGAGR